MDMTPMLEMNLTGSGRGLLDARPDQVQAPGLDLRWVIAAVRRRLWTTVLVTIAFAAIAVVYVTIRPSNYTAFTQLQLTNLKLSLGQDDAVFAEVQADPTFLETQLAIMRSRKIGLAALERIELVYRRSDSPGPLERGRAELTARLGPLLERYEGSDGGFLTTMFQASQAPAGTDEVKAREQRIALRQLQESYSVQRVGLSNIVEIRFAADTPEHAALGANEIAAVYVADQDASRAEFAQSGSIWLRERLKDVGTRTRVISTAAPPLNKSDMRGLLIIGIAGIVGFASGIAMSLALQLLDRTVRTAEDAEAVSGAECLGIVPRTKPRLFRCREHFQPVGARAEHDPALGRAPDFLCSPSAAKLRDILRNVQAALDDTNHGRGAACIGFTATREGEGTSTLAFAFASFLAAQRYRVLLIDFCPGPRSLSNALSPQQKEGLIEALAHESSVSDVMLKGSSSGLRFLPYGGASDGQGLSVMPRSAALSNFLGSIQQQFDAIVFDLPSLTSMGEVRSVAPHLDHIALVAECGKVEAAHMQAGIKAAGLLRGKLLGLILNKARTREIRNASAGSAFLLLPVKYRAFPLRIKARSPRVGSDVSV
jgi:succinoglycan biosynthesis transport protein ExoP